MPDQITRLLDQIDRLNETHQMITEAAKTDDIATLMNLETNYQSQCVDLAPQLAKAVRAVLAKCASMERGVGYRVSGQHDTWDSYHEGMSDMAGYIEETITDTLEGAD